MKSLEDAWRWYTDTRSLLKTLRCLADRHWDSLPWDGDLGKDDLLKTLEAPPLVRNADYCLEQLDDLAVAALFSVFESLVRQKVAAEVETESRTITHPVLAHAAAEAVKEVDRGNFSKVLRYLKGTGHNLVEHVRQVRQYRNWVTHGRRGASPFRLEPRAAYERLRLFLEALEIPVE